MVEKKLRILAASDIHDNKRSIEALAKKAIKENVDLVILAGDVHSYHEGDPKILLPLLNTHKKIFFIPGNCESNLEHERLKKYIRSLHKYYVTYNDVGIVGMGSPNWKLEHDLADFLEIKSQFKKMKPKKKILVSHLHASGTLAEGMGRFKGMKGDDVLHQVVKKFQPDILISGHIHEAEGVEDRIGNTRVFQVGKTGKVFEI